MKTLSAIILVVLFALAAADVDIRVHPALCHLPQDRGHCHRRLTQWWYDSRARECRRFIYSGCGGNRNRFHSKPACERKCKPVVELDICKLPSDSGPCKALGYRWYFNHGSGECEQFQYGGCGGNANNFATRLDCQNACRTDCKPVHCFVDPCQVKKCPGHPGARCVANYCTGCDADFFDRIGKLVDCDGDDCGKRGDPCDNPEYLRRFPRHKKRHHDCCPGFQCCACGPPHIPIGYIPPPDGTCRRHCRCPKG